MDVTFWDKLLSPAPFLVQLPFMLVAVIACLWVIDRVVFRSFDIWPSIRSGNQAVAIVVAVFIFIIAWGFYKAAWGAPTTRYDGHFRRAALEYFGPGFDWRWFKSQGIAESALRPRVCSHVGACGLMQFMPGTAKELGVDPFRPREAIWGGVRYDRRLWRQWSAPRPSLDRLSLSFASYNAGLGHVLNAQHAAGGCNGYPCIERFLWEEPRNYVERIRRWCGRLGGLCSTG